MTCKRPVCLLLEAAQKVRSLLSFASNLFFQGSCVAKIFWNFTWPPHVFQWLSSVLDPLSAPSAVPHCPLWESYFPLYLKCLCTSSNEIWAGSSILYTHERKHACVLTRMHARAMGKLWSCSPEGVAGRSEKSRNQSGRCGPRGSGESQRGIFSLSANKRPWTCSAPRALKVRVPIALSSLSSHPPPTSSARSQSSCASLPKPGF